MAARIGPVKTLKRVLDTILPWQEAESRGTLFLQQRKSLRAFLEEGCMYDPYRHALTLGLQVIHRPLLARWGEYRHQWATIVLSAELTELQARDTCAHEVAHAERGDEPTGQGWFDRRDEARADRVAARRLIDPLNLEKILELYPDDPARVAVELGVTRWLLVCALRERKKA